MYHLLRSSRRHKGYLYGRRWCQGASVLFLFTYYWLQGLFIYLMKLCFVMIFLVLVIVVWYFLYDMQWCEPCVERLRDNRKIVLPCILFKTIAREFSSCHFKLLRLICNLTFSAIIHVFKIYCLVADHMFNKFGNSKLEDENDEKLRSVDIAEDIMSHRGWHHHLIKRGSGLVHWHVLAIHQP